ncbi:MAG: hypothetical protein HXM94_00460 [Parvimonas micra]|uniref:Uncharacterized protein n=1 Tax=Parvimonas micra TaxID=33033 RepID=A0A930H1Z1_9FIRM|nr:hypothetical protein [Parvimonas micra]MBF1306245.1 hypothetical protein [Parvimonas micra]
MKTLEKSNLSKINEIIFSKDFDFEKLIKKSASIFFRKIESIIEFKNNYFELLNKQELKIQNKTIDETFDLTTFIKSRLKPIVLVFSLNSMLLEVYENDFYCKIINQSLNNKSIMITSIDLKTVINNEEFEKLVRLSEEEEEGIEELLYKIFKDYFENQFSEIITDKMIYLSKIIYSFPTDKSFIYELNHLLVQNELPLSILNNYELKNYIKSSITEGIKNTIFSEASYSNLDDKKLKSQAKNLMAEILSEFAKERELINLENGFAFASKHKLFENNLSYLKTLETVFRLECDLESYYFEFQDEPLFKQVCLDPIKDLKITDIESAKELLNFMIKKELFYYNSRFSKIILELTKKIGEYKNDIEIDASILFFGEDYLDFVNSLINFNVIKKIKLTINPDSVIKLFLGEQSTITNNLVDLYKDKKIEFSLNEDAKKSFDGLLIGIENGLVISEKEFIEKEIRNFISLFE